MKLTAVKILDYNCFGIMPINNVFRDKRKQKKKKSFTISFSKFSSYCTEKKAIKEKLLNILGFE